jgi:hypothetical protein
VVESCECGNEFLGFVKGGGFLTGRFSQEGLCFTELDCGILVYISVLYPFRMFINRQISYTFQLLN